MSLEAQPSSRTRFFGRPYANTGNPILDKIHNLMTVVILIERRFDPWFRPYIDMLLREWLSEKITDLVNSRRQDEGMRLAEERPQPNEEEYLNDMIASLSGQMRYLWTPGRFERGANTKTHGIVRAEFIVRDDLPSHMRQGLYAESRRYRAYVRFSGPGPYVTADIDDIGFMSISVKLMGVPGPKLIDDEQFTQDMFGLSTPAFATSTTRYNAQAQRWSHKNAGLLYFFNPRDPHLLDAMLQSLWTKTQTSPLEHSYYSCVPYLLGEGQAMQYSFQPRLKTRSRVPGLPGRPPDNYLREAMARTLARQDVEFDVTLQLQKDPFRMPIEHNNVMWSPRISPRIPAAVLRIPRQTFDSPEQLAFARALTFNPWHSIPEHRPLGNQSRARKRLYYELSRLRQSMNQVHHLEPTGDEVFPGSDPLPA